ncbi:fungal-specific transcription factor domain-containing protein [Aspergillus minisclerotigenes]|uniref:Fungal-specific transcription factor domain-containing protein n=1 Tax=Aspergillus minisclerotigenes TaxID=656917 RepID=A0A5N6J3M2_9EURO|nr:fungal-specific transcription factor domain-containing protein [Aspergillus minisclerotigenes]
MESASRSKGRRYGFACLVCRRRKVKCDGRWPTCVNCARLKETCSYKEKTAYTVRLTEALRSEQARVQELQKNIRELAAMDNARRDIRLADLVSQLDLNGQEPVELAQSTDVRPSSTDREAQDRYPADDISNDVDTQFSIDTEGRQHYFGATSRFHPIPGHDHRHDTKAEINEPETQEMENYHRRWLCSNARFQGPWERMAHANMSHYTHVDPNICSSLLNVYWSWQAPLHNCIYRRCFYRDMALGGPYFSRFLLNVVFAHACRHMPEDDPRFSQFERGETFLREAMLLLIDEMQQSKPQIPTIQGLLILGGRQCAVGKSSEGWLYTGMAIRMVTDLGLHIKRSQASLLKEFEPDDLEVRKRLYLSVYAWDKSISLCLGRPPSLKDTPYLPSTLFDLSDEDELWQPPHLLDTDQLYPETKCHSTLTFVHFCNLAQIINESYKTVYIHPSRNINPDDIFRLEEKLVSFHKNLPSSLRFEEGANVQTCVPPHILCLNILCHTVLILLYRPFFIWCWDAELQRHPLALRAQIVCTEQAAGVNDLFRAYGRLFNFQYQSYLVSYCVYTAATIDVRLARHEDKAIAEMATGRLAITLRMLETEVKQTPGIRRSIEIIRSQIGAPLASNLQRQARRSSEVPDRGPSNREKATGIPLQSVIDTLPQMVSPPPTMSNTSIYGSSTECVATGPSQLPLLEMSGIVVNPNLSLESGWPDWYMNDFGGGFVPDVA